MRDALFDLRPAALPDRGRPDKGNDGMPGVEQLLHLDPKLSPDVERRLQEGPIRLAAVEDALIRQPVGEVDLEVSGSIRPTIAPMSPCSYSS
jgi:hypothetical protein